MICVVNLVGKVGFHVSVIQISRMYARKCKRVSGHKVVGY